MMIQFVCYSDNIHNLNWFEIKRDSSQAVIVKYYDIGRLIKFGSVSMIFMMFYTFSYDYLRLPSIGQLIGTQIIAN